MLFAIFFGVSGLLMYNHQASSKPRSATITGAAGQRMNDFHSGLLAHLRDRVMRFPRLRRRLERRSRKHGMQKFFEIIRAAHQVRRSDPAARDRKNRQNDQRNVMLRGDSWT